MKRRFELGRNESGVTSIEYALVGFLIAVVIVAAVGRVGTSVETLYRHVADCVQSATGSGAGTGC